MNAKELLQTALFSLSAMAFTGEVTNAQETSSLPVTDEDGDGSISVTDLVLVGQKVKPTLQNGDIDGNGALEITDVIRLVDYLYRGGDPPVPSFCEVESSGPAPSAPAEDSLFGSIFVVSSASNGDIDGNGSLGITDVIRLAQYLFLGGSAPAEISCEIQS